MDAKNEVVEKILDLLQPPELVRAQVKELAMRNPIEYLQKRLAELQARVPQSL